MPWIQTEKNVETAMEHLLKEQDTDMYGQSCHSVTMEDVEIYSGTLLL
jgi:hypothetical protein